jgi:hypothetical protein
MRAGADTAVAASATAAAGTKSPAAGSRTSRRLVAAVLLAAAALDLARCILVMTTSRHPGPAACLVAEGIGAAALSITAALGCRAGHRWAAWAALLIGAASAPQASASGFHSPFTIPDAATAGLGILLTVTILTSAGRTGTPGPCPELPSLLEKLSSEQQIARSEVSAPASQPHAAPRR